MTDTSKQQARFAVTDKKSFDYDKLKSTIEGQTSFKVGKVLSGP